jgi:SWI/SNF-related matrix-associated actin-dependent regulator of chromatin subfamily B member 1
MNSYPPFSNQDYQQHQSSINPALLAAFHNQHNQSTSAKFQYGTPTATTAASPASSAGGSINPAQLMNGIGMSAQMGVNGHSINPAQVLQQQHQQQQHQQNQTLQHQQHLAGISLPNGGLGVGMSDMGAMGINPAALSSPAQGLVGGGLMSPNLAMPGLNGGAATMGMGMSLGMGGVGMNMGGNPNMNAGSVQNALPGSNPISQQQQQQQQQQGNAQPHPLALTRQQIAQMSPQERQALQTKVMLAHHQQQQQQQQQQQEIIAGMLRAGANVSGGIPNTNAGFFHRDHPSGSPSSSMPNNLIPGASGLNSQNQNSLHNQVIGGQGQTGHPQNQNQMMPPPPARPPTAQSQQHSRPGTSQSHHSPRPASRTASEYAQQFSASGGNMNGYPGKQPQPQNIYPGQVHGQPQSQSQPGQGSYTQNVFAQQQQQSSSSSSYPSQNQQQMFLGSNQTQNLNQNHNQNQNLGQLSSPYPSGQMQQNLYASTTQVPHQQQSTFMQFPGDGGVVQGHGQGGGQPMMSPPPASPRRGAKRKVGGMESPRLGGGMNSGGMGMMGPPVLPRQLSEQQQVVNAHQQQLGQGQINGFSQQQLALAAGNVVRIYGLICGIRWLMCFDERSIAKVDCLYHYR